MYGVSGTWRKSTRSNICDNCVELSLSLELVAIRDSKDRGGAVLVFGPEAWQDFLVGVRQGEFDV